ncbi:hypothetical protein LQW54_007192 [Pestalotiopsis sp. IQ-011]
MSTLHRFPLLPPELRHLVWSLAADPRIVEVRVMPDNPGEVNRLISWTSTPAVVQACQEARYYGPYKKAFTELCPPKVVSSDALRIGSPYVIVAADRPRRHYVWLNFDLDIISIGLNPIKPFSPVASSIQRLMFESRRGPAWTPSSSTNDIEELLKWTNTKEIFFDERCGRVCGLGPPPNFTWPCGRENFWVCSSHTMYQGSTTCPTISWCCCEVEHGERRIGETTSPWVCLIRQHLYIAISGMVLGIWQPYG